MTRHKTSQPRQMTAAEFDKIAFHTTLSEAVERTTPRERDRPNRMADAWHEGAHIVAAACFGARTAGYCIPVRGAGGQRIHASTGSVYARAGMNLDRLSPEWREDDTTHFERAVINYVGEVAEGVIGMVQGPPVWGRRTTDGTTAETNVCEAMRLISLDIEAAVSLGLKAPEPTTPPPEEWDAIAACRRLVHKATTACVWDNFELIDAVAAAMLLHADASGQYLYPQGLSEAVIAQTKLPAWARSCAGRVTAYARPDWLSAPSRFLREDRDYFHWRRVKAENFRQKILEARTSTPQI